MKPSMSLIPTTPPSVGWERACGLEAQALAHLATLSLTHGLLNTQDRPHPPLQGHVQRAHTAAALLNWAKALRGVRDGLRMAANVKKRPGLRLRANRLSRIAALMAEWAYEIDPEITREGTH